MLLRVQNITIRILQKFQVGTHEQYFQITKKITKIVILCLNNTFHKKWVNYIKWVKWVNTFFDFLVTVKTTN